MKKTRVCIVISQIGKSLAFEWIHDHIDHTKFDLSYLLIGSGSSDFSSFLQSRNARQVHILYSNKWDLFSAFWKSFWLLKKLKPDVIHTHLLEASLIGLTVGWLLRTRKRIFTRHHAMVHHEDYPSGLKFDKWCNHIATDIIAPSQNVKDILSSIESVTPDKIHLIHHGFDFSYFNTISQERIDRLQMKLGITDQDYPIIGIIARYIRLKGIQYVIPAFSELLKNYPGAKLVLANARGDYSDKIRSHLNQLPADSFIEIEFESDLAALYKLFDLYVHIPLDQKSESFGQTYVESLACGIPSIFTLSGVATEFIVHKKNAWVLKNGHDPEEILSAINTLLENQELVRPLVLNGIKDVQHYFSISQQVARIQSLYGEAYE